MVAGGTCGSRRLLVTESVMRSLLRAVVSAVTIATVSLVVSQAAPDTANPTWNNCSADALGQAFMALRSVRMNSALVTG